MYLLFLSRADKRPLLSTGWDNGEPCLPGSGGALCLEFQEIGEQDFAFLHKCEILLPWGIIVLRRKAP